MPLTIAVQVKLIVLDSISAHTKPVLLDKAERAHVFALAKTAFTRATTVHSCAVGSVLPR